MGGAQPTSGQLIDLVRDPQSQDALRDYFLIEGNGYSGRAFNTLCGGGDRPDSADRITADDLLALRLLNMPVAHDLPIEFLDGGGAGLQVSYHLKHVPADVMMGSPKAAALVAEGSHAAKAWHVIRGRNRRVTAFKLLARKRPHLLPVYDSIVECALGSPRPYWMWLHEQLALTGLTERLSAVRSSAGLSDEIPLIRVFDVVVWMRHKGAHRRKGCSGLF